MSGSMWRMAYTLGLYLMTPFVLLRLWWRGSRTPTYRHRWGERFGFVKPMRGVSPLWIHAVSVGEVQAAVPLIHWMFVHHPDVRILVTTTTPTGSRRVIETFGKRVHHTYAPYDLPDVVARFLDRTRPRVAVIMETELWPNLFHACHNRGIPLIVANARLSQRSALGYARVTALAQSTLSDVDLIAAQATADAERFIALGAAREHVHVTGSIKFDSEFPADLHMQAEALRREWGTDRPVWIAASTHEGEEELALLAHAELQRHLPGALLVLVPRHPERFGKVAELCRRQGHAIVLRSERRSCDMNTSVYIGDTMGELPLFFAASDVAFVGGSLVPHGGHNILEPAALGLPVIVGPHTFNFTDITRMLIDAGGAICVSNVQELADELRVYLADENRRQAAGKKACEVVEKNRGALHALTDIITPYLKKRNYE